MKGVTGSQKKARTSIREVKKIEPVSRPVDRVIARKKVETNYNDDEIAASVFTLIDKQEFDLAKNLIETNFQSLNLSPLGRKQLLFLLK